MTRFSNIALITALSLAPVAAYAAPTNTTVVTEHARTSGSVAQTTPAPVTADADKDAARYADREQQDTKAADYKGGSVVIVASGGALLVALLVLLILI